MLRVQEALNQLPPTPYHVATSLAFTNDPKDVAVSLDRFLETQSKKFSVGAVYTETNGFYINPDRWYFGWFGYEAYGGVEGTDWLAYWDSEPEAEETLTGMEELQRVYEYHQNVPGSENVQQAQSLCDWLVVLRFQQLIQRSAPLSFRLAVPLLSTAHEFDLFYVYRPPNWSEPTTFPPVQPPRVAEPPAAEGTTSRFAVRTTCCSRLTTSPRTTTW